MNPPVVQHISECFIKPQYSSEDSKQPIYLSPWDLAMPLVNYIQKGLLFVKLSDHQDLKPLLERLKESLSLTLIQFYPLAGRLATFEQQDPPRYSIYIDTQNSPGARFIHASLDLSISDILSPVDVPLVVQSFFDHDRAINHDGHTKSLLSVQVTELVDGIFIGCSINHMVVDGTSYWSFFNAWSEIFRSGGGGGGGGGKINDVHVPRISCPPIHKRWIPEGHGPILNLPFINQDELITRYEAPPLRERIFHFSSQSIAKLKAKANSECKTTTISSLQALSALVWRCITRARNFPHEQQTSCRLATNNRTRLEPQVPRDYFGNCIQTVRGMATAGELLEHGLGWAAWLLNQAVANHSDKAVREWVDGWVKSPFVYHLGEFFDPCSVMMGSSPRFDMYGNEFGMGKPVAIRSGYANKFDGKVTMYPGCEGGGSMDLEMCLSPDSMRALESDEEFMEAVYTCI